MAGLLGINTSGDGSVDPAVLAAAGTRWVRCVVRENHDILEWISTLLHTHNIETLLVGDGSPESLGTDEATWTARMEAFKAQYGGLVKTWQFGNEPDNQDPNSIASWTMPQEMYNRLLTTARAVFPRPEFTLIGAGLDSGQPGWLDGVELELIDVLDLHPYAKLPDTPELLDMLNGYRGRKQPIWCSEYDSRTKGMGAYLLTQVDRAAVMCWSSDQTNSEGLALGLQENAEALAEFVSSAAAVAILA